VAQQAALDKLAEATTGLSCRDIKEACEHAERQLASKLIRDNNQATEEQVPTVENYLSCINARRGPVPGAVQA
jgi:hypothetical protein